MGCVSSSQSQPVDFSRLDGGTKKLVDVDSTGQDPSECASCMPEIEPKPRLSDVNAPRGALHVECEGAQYTAVLGDETARYSRTPTIAEEGQWESSQMPFLSPSLGQSLKNMDSGVVPSLEHAIALDNGTPEAVRKLRHTKTMGDDGSPSSEENSCGTARRSVSDIHLMKPAGSRARLASLDSSSPRARRSGICSASGIVSCNMSPTASGPVIARRTSSSSSLVGFDEKILSCVIDAKRYPRTVHMLKRKESLSREKAKLSELGQSPRRATQHSRPIHRCQSSDLIGAGGMNKQVEARKGSKGKGGSWSTTQKELRESSGSAINKERCSSVEVAGRSHMEVNFDHMSIS